MGVEAGMSDLTNPPDASRLIDGLRDTGYNFNTAAADVIDNSIAAEATVVNVQIAITEEGRKFVYFGDNGHGMTAEDLFGAMRYGAKPREDLASLGKFGLGLKTASTSVCKCLTVISRRNVSDNLAKLSWDLDHVHEINSWEMVRDAVSIDEQEIFDDLCGEKGTLVIWSKCDRLLQKDYAQPGGAQEKAAIKRLTEKLAEHVALVYHRFLDRNDVRAGNVSIFVGGKEVAPWNPFFPSRSEQVLGEIKQKLECEIEDGSVHQAYLRAWILPHTKDCSPAEKEQIKHANNRQGFYVFRENRLIHNGGWLGIHGWGAMEPHMSLLRIEFDFDHHLDEAFMVDVKKSRILLDPALEEYVQKLISPIRREADSRFRRRSQEVIAGKGIDHTSSNNSISQSPTVKKPTVIEADAATNTAVVSNHQGPSIRLKVPVEDRVKPENIYVDAVDNIHSGGLWEPSLRSTTDSGHVVGVRINKHHDFYQKIYQRASSSGYSVEGMDLLLWAFAAAEQNHSNPELQSVFEDIRDEVSSNLRKLLRDIELPDDGDRLSGDESVDE